MQINKHIDKLGIAGLLLTALLSPCCFPLFAFAASALGLGSAELFGGYTMYIFQAMVVISLIGLYISYRKHKCLYPLIVALPSSVLIFYTYNFSNTDYYTYYIYAAMLGLLVATIWNYKRNKMHNTNQIQLQSQITCPHCNHKKIETMPTNACTYFYQCQNCNKRLQPKQGDCCVFCSYGTVKCPPIQQGMSCC